MRSDCNFEFVIILIKFSINYSINSLFFHLNFIHLNFRLVFGSGYGSVLNGLDRIGSDRNKVRIGFFG